MAKLYFRYGTVGSAKTMNLLAVAHNYRQQGKEVLLMKPALDVRFGTGEIRSRAGLVEEADILLHEHSVIDSAILSDISCILIDEAQFLSEFVIEQLRRFTIVPGVPVICYGLRQDFRTRAFAGALRLMEIADSIEEIKTTCAYCNKKAIFNLKHVNEVATLNGPSIDLGAEEKYLPVCFECYYKELLNAGYAKDEICKSGEEYMMAV